VNPDVTVDTPLPPVAGMTGVRVTTRGDTAIVEFDPVDGARDYRIYTLPAASDVKVGTDGVVSVTNAVYRCAGDRPRYARESDQAEAARFPLSLGGDVKGYARTEAGAVLGYVYPTDGPGRKAVYRVGNPSQNGGYAWETQNAPTAEHNAADYVVGTAARDALLAKGWRDDGIAFYAPDDGTLSVHRREYAADSYGHVVSLFYTDGPEHDARDQEPAASIASSAERFKILEAAAEGTVPLHRVFYVWANSHDVLAAGEARFQLALHQGNQPNPSLTWPALQKSTTLVVEALDQGCPFPGGYVGFEHRPSVAVGGIPNQPIITLDEARLATGGNGEAFVNGQHETTNRPRAIARAFLEASPQEHPQMDWLQTFDPGGQWDPFTEIVSDNIGTRVYRNSQYSLELIGCIGEPSFGPLLGQLAISGECNSYVVPRGIEPAVSPDHYLHVRMATEIPSTFRRYPQLLITTTPEADPATVPGTGFVSYKVPIPARLGPVPFEMLPPGTEKTIIIQPFGVQPELQVQFCDQRGWGVSQQCPRANVYGYTAGVQETSATPPSWLPVPVLGDISAFDRPVQFDVYASTERIYVFLDGRPGGCAVLPEGRMPAGRVNVLFGYVGYHIEIDPPVVDDTGTQQYWHRWSQTHLERRMDDLGVDLNAAKPAWDESILPCGTRWYVDP
jgi:hypothetical protein